MKERWWIITEMTGSSDEVRMKEVRFRPMIRKGGRNNPIGLSVSANHAME